MKIKMKDKITRRNPVVAAMRLCNRTWVKSSKPIYDRKKLKKVEMDD